MGFGDGHIVQAIDRERLKRGEGDNFSLDVEELMNWMFENPYEEPVEERKEEGTMEGNEEKVEAVETEEKGQDREDSGKGEEEKGEKEDGERGEGGGEQKKEGDARKVRRVPIKLRQLFAEMMLLDESGLTNFDNRSVFSILTLLFLFSDFNFEADRKFWLETKRCSNTTRY
jgi:hypothetical protein